MDKVRTQGILEVSMGNPKMRARLAALSFTEKIKILEKLRDRERAIAAAGLRVKAVRNDDTKVLKESKG